MQEKLKKMERRFDIPSNTPADTIEEIDGQLVGAGYFYEIENGEPVLHSIQFNVPTQSESLPPFKYRKPIVGDDPFTPREDAYEERERVGNIPLGIVLSAYRGPNHWHRPDSAVFCAVKVDGVWQTRYFPQQNIPATTWMAAKRILSKEL